MTLAVSPSWDLHMCHALIWLSEIQIRLFSIIFGKVQTDRQQKAMHMSQLCKVHRWAQQWEVKAFCTPSCRPDHNNIWYYFQSTAVSADHMPHLMDISSGGQHSSGLMRLPGMSSASSSHHSQIIKQVVIKKIIYTALSASDGTQGFLQLLMPHAPSTFSTVYLFEIWYIAIAGIVNVVIFAVYSSRCAFYFKMCGQRCIIHAQTKNLLKPLSLLSQRLQYGVFISVDKF